MFIRRGNLADVRRYVCNKLRYALQCQNPLREGWGSGWVRKRGKEGKQCKDRLVQE